MSASLIRHPDRDAAAIIILIPKFLGFLAFFLFSDLKLLACYLFK